MSLFAFDTDDAKLFFIFQLYFLSLWLFLFWFLFNGFLLSQKKRFGLIEFLFDVLLLFDLIKLILINFQFFKSFLKLLIDDCWIDFYGLWSLFVNWWLIILLFLFLVFSFDLSLRLFLFLLFKLLKKQVSCLFCIIIRVFELLFLYIVWNYLSMLKQINVPIVIQYQLFWITFNLMIKSPKYEFIKIIIV